MYDTLVSLFESWGISSSNAVSQAEFLTDLPAIGFAIWETVYAPALATVFAYLLGLPPFSPSPFGKRFTPPPWRRCLPMRSAFPWASSLSPARRAASGPCREC